MAAVLQGWALRVEPYVYFMLLLTVAVLPLEQVTAGLCLLATFCSALLVACCLGRRQEPVLRPWEQGACYLLAAIALLSLGLSRRPAGSALFFVYTVGQYLAFSYVLLRYGWRRPSRFGLAYGEAGASPQDEAAMADLIPLVRSVPRPYRDRFFSLPRPLQLLGVFFGSSCLVSLLGLGQKSAGVAAEGVWVDPAAFPELAVRVYSTWQNPNILAGYLVLVIAYSLAFFYAAKGRSWLRLLTGCSGLLAFFCLLYTYSRGNYLACGAVLLLYCGCFNRRALLPVLVVVAASLLLGGEELWQRLASLAGSQDTSIALRQAYLRSTWWIIQEHPLGVGWAGFQYIYPDYNYYLADKSVIMYHCHNLFLNVLAELGWLGLGVFLTVWGIFIYQAYRLARSNPLPWLRALGQGYLLAALGVAVGGLTDHVYFNPRLGLLFWLLSFSVLLGRRLAACYQQG